MVNTVGTLLRGKAREAVLRLPPQDLTDYRKVKTALLRFFRLDAEAYRLRFRTMKKELDETFEQLVDRMIACLDLWCLAAGKKPHSAKDLGDLFLLYRVLTPDLTTEVRRASPKTAEDVAHEATVVAEAKRLGLDCQKERDEMKLAQSKSRNHRPPVESSRDQETPRDARDLGPDINRNHSAKEPCPLFCMYRAWTHS